MSKFIKRHEEIAQARCQARRAARVGSSLGFTEAPSHAEESVLVFFCLAMLSTRQNASHEKCTDHGIHMDLQCFHSMMFRQNVDFGAFIDQSW